MKRSNKMTLLILKWLLIAFVITGMNTEHTDKFIVIYIEILLLNYEILRVIYNEIEPMFDNELN